MIKPRFGLRVLLALPLCVAAFYVGWTAHAANLRSMHQEAGTIAQEQQATIRRELSLQRTARAAALRAREAAVRDSIDVIEQRDRLKAYERMLDDPIGSHMFPEGGY